MEARQISHDDKVYCFGEFQLCTRARELVHLDQADHHDNAANGDVVGRGLSIMLEPKALDLLIYLVENRDRVVSKAELHEVLWEMRPLSETVLAHCVMKARQALGDDGRRQAFIRTIRGHGYRFIAEASAIARPEHPGDQPAPAGGEEAARTLPGPIPESSAVAGPDAAPRPPPATQSTPASRVPRAAYSQEAPNPEAVRSPGPAAEPFPGARRRRNRFSFSLRQTLFAAFMLVLFFALGLLTSELVHSYLG